MNSLVTVAISFGIFICLMPLIIDILKFSILCPMVGITCIVLFIVLIKILNVRG